MRLRPDANLATAMREKIASAQAQKQKQQGIERAIKYISVMPPSTAFPNGRTDLIALLKADLITPADAIQSATKVEKPTALTEKFNKLEALKLKHGGVDKIPPLQLQLLNLSQKEVNSVEEYEFYKKGLKEDETPMDYYSFLGRDDNSDIEKFEYYKKDLPKGETPMSFTDFLKIGSAKTEITVEAQKVKETNIFWEAYNKSIVEEIDNWQREAPDTRGNIVKLKDVLDSLSDPNALLTGAIIGQMPDFVMNFLNPEAVGAREAVEGVVQRNLKAVLGGQFTEREGEKLVKRAYNPQLSQEENAKRLRILIEQMERAADMQDYRQKYVFKHGTMRGFDGELPTNADFWTALSANQMGDVVCDSSADNKNRKCWTYQGGNDKLESSWKLVE
jgi:hypothetical protein